VIGLSRRRSVRVLLSSVVCAVCACGHLGFSEAEQQSLLFAGVAPQAASDQQKWTIKHTLKHESGVTVVAMSPSGREVAAGGILSAGISVWDVERGTLIGQITGLKGSTQALADSPDGRLLAAGRGMIKSTDIILQRLQPPQAATRFAPHGVGMVESLQYSPDSQSLAVGFKGGVIGIYEAATGHLKKRVTLNSSLQGPVAYSPKGNFLAFGQWKKDEGELFGHYEIQLLDTNANGGVIKTFSGHTGAITALAFDPHGKFLASGTNTGTTWEKLDEKTNQMVRKRNEDPIRIWNLDTGVVVKELVGHIADVTSLVLLEDGQFLISGSQDKTIKLWDVARGELLSTMTGHNDLVDSIVVSPDGKYLVSGGNSPDIKVWERRQ
jgi:WD40 repeat protein